MKKVIFASFATLFTTVALKAQDLEVVKKTIESEKFSEAKWRHEVPEMAKLAKISAEDENLVLTYVLESIK